MSVYRVLVVDDNQSFCQQVVASFAEPASKASGEVVIEAHGCPSGQQALPLIARLMPNVVVVDLVRLGSEGRFLIERLLSERSHYAPCADGPGAGASGGRFFRSARRR
jgi:CheY-like chemotaxis protein